MRTLRLALLAGSIALLVGCNGKEPAGYSSAKDTAAVTETVPAKPEERLYSLVHAGNYQVGAFLDSLESAYHSAKELEANSADGEVRTRIAEIAGVLDKTGRAMTEDYGAEPTREAVAADMKGFNAKRKKMIDDANDSLHDLAEVRDMLSRLQTSADSTSGSNMNELGKLIDVAMDDLRGTVEALGGARNDF